jgi:hypothetical protein
MYRLDRGDPILSKNDTPTEHVEQREFVSWFRKTHKGVRIFAVPNGGARNITTAARLKAEGVTSGVPDLFIPAWLMWIEMKRQKGGVVSPDQTDWIAYLRGVGHLVIVSKGAEDAKNQIMGFKNEKA